MKVKILTINNFFIILISSNSNLSSSKIYRISLYIFAFGYSLNYNRTKYKLNAVYITTYYFSGMCLPYSALHIIFNASC